MTRKESTTVYSSAVGGRLCPACDKLLSACICQQLANGNVIGDGKVRVMLETKGRKGKGVSLISGIPLRADELLKLAKKLKKTCGSGGAVKNGVIEIQGDHRDKIILELEKLKYQVKRSGG